MYLYKTVFGYSEAEYIIERSRFIAHVSPVATPEEARAFVASIKERYKDATHNVPAFVCGSGKEHQWASDDGEPAGTSGMPVLKLITYADMTNLVIVVTRYFGGIKLGTGGLARAYTHAASLAIEKAGICAVEEGVRMVCSVDYTYLGKIQNLAAGGSFSIEDTEYTDVVTLTLTCPSEYSVQMEEQLSDVTGGKAFILSSEPIMVRRIIK